MSKAVVARVAREDNRCFTTRGWKFSWISLQDLCPKDGLGLESALAKLKKVNHTVEAGLARVKAAGKASR